MHYAFKDAAGKTANYFVEEINNPDNVKATPWSAYRDYARFGACPKVEIKDGQTATLRYRFVVTSGKAPTRADFQAQADAYVKDAKAEKAK